MKPKRKEDILENISDRLIDEFDPETVDSVVDFFYKEVRKTLSSGEAIRVVLPKLGDLNMMPWALDKKIEKISYLRNVKYAKAYTPRGLAIKDDMETILEGLKNMKMLQSREDKKRLKKKLEREEYEKSK
jgi:hypothetical protein